MENKHDKELSYLTNKLQLLQSEWMAYRRYGEALEKQINLYELQIKLLEAKNAN